MTSAHFTPYLLNNKCLVSKRRAYTSYDQGTEVLQEFARIVEKWLESEYLWEEFYAHCRCSLSPKEPYTHK